jgi:hypothetical protein
MKALSLFYEPLLTLEYFFKFVWSFHQSFFYYFKIFIAFSAVSLILFPSTYLFCLYWFILGVMASIGFGTGMYTGILFLTPHIIQVAIKNGPDNLMMTFLELYLPTMMWGLGTAIGELPPYFMAQTKRNNRELYNNPLDAYISNEFLEKAFQKYGFWIMIFFSSYPNMFFDVCGFMAGYYLMTPLSFLSALIIGKVFIKAINQMHLTVLFVFADRYLTWLPSGMMIPSTDYLTDDSFFIYIFKLLILVITCIFIKDFIETVANQVYYKKD